MNTQIFALPFISLLAAFASSAAGTGNIDPAVSEWLRSQAQVRSWSAEVLQIRKLKSLTEPLTNHGRVWFAAPNQFRWELGQPARTIAVRTPDALLVVYPRLKQVEKFSLKANKQNPWRDALALLEAGFPRSEADLLAQYRITGQEVRDKRCELALEPRSAGARKMMPQIQITFGTVDHQLHATELAFADGSRMRNEFNQQVTNPEVDSSLFEPRIPTDFKVVEPLAK